MFDFRQQLGRFVLKQRPLLGKVLFGILAGAVLKVEVAQVFVQLLLALEEVI